jgi:DNA-binding MarR family transcriptional regulator
MSYNHLQTDTVELSNTLIPCLGRTAKLMTIYMQQKFMRFNVDLTPKQWIVLRHLIEEDGLEQKHLAMITERDKTSLTRLISTLEKKGLVRREVSVTDKRVNHLFITTSGKEAYTATLPLIAQSIQELQNGIDKEDLDLAIATIGKVRDNIRTLTSQNPEHS